MVARRQSTLLGLSHLCEGLGLLVEHRRGRCRGRWRHTGDGAQVIESNGSALLASRRSARPRHRTLKFSHSRRYFYTRRFTYELTGLLSEREYHGRVSAKDPFGNVGMTTGTVTNYLDS